MGIEPTEKDYLIEVTDMFYETQQAFNLYSFLPERWEGMNGIYLGKDATLLPYLFDLNDIGKQEQKYILNIIQVIDSAVGENIRKKQDALRKSK